MKRFIFLLTFLAIFKFLPAEAQAVCEGVTGSGRCNATNDIFGTMPTTNVDGTAFNDFASVSIVFGPNSPVCTPAGLPTAGSQIKNVGALGVPITPLPNTVTSHKLGIVGFANGLQVAAWKVVDTTGNMSACSNEVKFIFDNGASNAATNLGVR